MPIATYTLPSGWKVEHDIAIDIPNGGYSRYKHDMLGPRGEMIRSLLPVSYGTQLGSFDQVWQQNARQALQNMIQDVVLGKRLYDGPLVKKIQNSQFISQDIKQAGVKKIFEVNVTGTKNGEPYEGKLLVADIPTNDQFGLIILGILISPTGMLTQTIETNIKITETRKPNLKYGQTLQSIMECQPIWLTQGRMADFITIDGKLVRNDPRILNPDLYRRCRVLETRLLTATKKAGNADGYSEFDSSPVYQPDEIKDDDNDYYTYPEYKTGLAEDNNKSPAKNNATENIE